MRYSNEQQEHIVVHFKYDWMNEIWENKFSFFGVFMVIATLSYGALYALDFYPELTFDPTDPVAWVNYGENVISKVTPAVAVVDTQTMVKNETPDTAEVVTPTVKQPVTQNTERKDVQAPAVTNAQNSLPLRLIIEKLNRDVKILNPQETSVAALDAALLSGVVRHPDSADFAKTGTMFILGHSSYLPTVHNKNFQALNGIQKLEWGDTVRIQSATTEYLYRVQKVYEVKASTASANIQWEKAELTLVTCDTFGAKDDRFVVEAYLVDSYPIKKG